MQCRCEEGLNPVSSESSTEPFGLSHTNAGACGHERPPPWGFNAASVVGFVFHDGTH